MERTYTWGGSQIAAQNWVIIENFEKYSF